jgi:hypothetical protein
VATRDPFLLRARQASADVAPYVREVLGVGPYRFDVAVTDENIPGLSAARTRPDRCLVVFGRVFEVEPDEALYYVAAHEVAHVYMREHWETLPDWLEEGLADVVALEVVPSARADAESHIRVSGRFERYEYARELGVAAVRDLALRAVAAGLDEVPEAWVVEVGGALPELPQRVQASRRVSPCTQ